MTFLAILAAVFAAFTTALTWSMKQFKWGAYLEQDQEPITIPAMPTTPPQAPAEPPQAVPTPIPAPDKVRICALAQQTFEGWYLPGSIHDGVAYPNGSDSYQHNDPGNCRNLDGQDIQFATYEAGLAYLEDYICRVATGKHSAYPKGGDTTIMEYTHTYTGDLEPAPTNYAISIAKDLGTTTEQKMSWLLV